MVEETKNEAEPAEEKKTLIFNLFSFSIACEQKGASVYEKIQKYTQSLVVGLLNLIIIFIFNNVAVQTSSSTRLSYYSL